MYAKEFSIWYVIWEEKKEWIEMGFKAKEASWRVEMFANAYIYQHKRLDYTHMLRVSPVYDSIRAACWHWTYRTEEGYEQRNLLVCGAELVCELRDASWGKGDMKGDKPRLLRKSNGYSQKGQEESHQA